MRTPLPWVSAVLLSLALATSAAARKPTERMSDRERGELLYQRHCGSCHGPTGAGNGPVSDALVVDVPDLRGRITKEARDGHVRLVLDGRGAMPGFSVSLDRHDVHRVLRYLAEIAPADAPARPAPDEAP